MPIPTNMEDILNSIEKIHIYDEVINEITTDDFIIDPITKIETLSDKENLYTKMKNLRFSFLLIGDNPDFVKTPKYQYVPLIVCRRNKQYYVHAIYCMCEYDAGAIRAYLSAKATNVDTPNKLSHITIFDQECDSIIFVTLDEIKTVIDDPDTEIIYADYVDFLAEGNVEKIPKELERATEERRPIEKKRNQARANELIRAKISNQIQEI